MALTTWQTIGLTALGLTATALGANQIMKARERKRQQGQLGAPTCSQGLTPRMVDGQWQCLPVTPFEDCLQGVYSASREALPDAIYQSLNDNAKKTADQFYGFNLSPEAMQQAWTTFMAQFASADEPEAVYYGVLSTLMPCDWPLMAAGSSLPGFTDQPIAQLGGWPLQWNMYLDAPVGVSDRMATAAMALAHLWFVAAAQTMGQFFALDVDPVNFISDPEVDACARNDVLDPRAAGVPTSEKIILGALSVAGYETNVQNVDEIMGALEQENPLLIEYLDGDWRISAEMQERMWDLLTQVAAFPRPVTNIVYNAQQGQGCAWDEKDRYTLSMTTLWFAAKRLAAIAELAGMILPVTNKEGA